jgi:type I site-specific restriction-modification system R (restriction) subunit
MLLGMCGKDNFLDLMENFIVFDDSSGKTSKILARNHQFLGVNRAFTATQQRQVREGRLGVFWHTQGSGKSYLMRFLTLIHKFNKPGEIYSQRDDIIVISDEAHRTQYGKLAENMRSGLPNASFIGFTGTPLMDSESDQRTREVFGDYVSTYDFQRAVEDGATVPLYYDNR